MVVVGGGSPPELCLAPPAGVVAGRSDALRLRASAQPAYALHAHCTHTARTLHAHGTHTARTERTPPAPLCRRVHAALSVLALTLTLTLTLILTQTLTLTLTLTTSAYDRPTQVRP